MGHDSRRRCILFISIAKACNANGCQSRLSNIASLFALSTIPFRTVQISLSIIHTPLGNMISFLPSSIACRARVAISLVMCRFLFQDIVT